MKSEKETVESAGAMTGSDKVHELTHRDRSSNVNSTVKASNILTNSPSSDCVVLDTYKQSEGSDTSKHHQYMLYHSYKSKQLKGQAQNHHTIQKQSKRFFIMALGSSMAATVCILIHTVNTNHNHIPSFPIKIRPQTDSKQAKQKTGAMMSLNLKQESLKPKFKPEMNWVPNVL
jgi:hypothetical protein